jgi:hypothetical protein
MNTWKIVVEKHPDGYVAYPLGLKGVVVGEGDTSEAALAGCQSAIRFHMETFGPDALSETAHPRHRADATPSPDISQRLVGAPACSRLRGLKAPKAGHRPALHSIAVPKGLGRIRGRLP